ncbi:hypothetical protein DdX_17981 [Ditylenchus destructor]|uniref:Uncharacterized protein n=1 Tax=Ditylenchus destructor TaxID=166010 RepID=A0AAD4MKQ9_9BILA|nr:hypothetical protein DdX_17981 [Ditylenchus destructor]
MGAVFFPRVNRGEDREIRPFRLQSEQQRKKILDKCSELISQARSSTQEINDEVCDMPQNRNLLGYDHNRFRKQSSLRCDVCYLQTSDHTYRVNPAKDQKVSTGKRREKTYLECVEFGRQSQPGGICFVVAQSSDRYHSVQER